MKLVTAAGWNQTERDWQRVIDYHPGGCFKAVRDGRLIGTVTSTAYGRELAWIGMMLVDPACRRQGFGQALMVSVISSLKRANIQTIKLDATPAGRPLYELLGFKAQFDFQRWHRPESNRIAVPLEPASVDQLEEHRDLDRRVFGVDRWSWLMQVAADSQYVSLRDGFGMMRTGRIASYLGPVVSKSIESCHILLSKLVESTTTPIFWDMIQRDCDALSHVSPSHYGFEPARTLTRMVLETDTTSPNLQQQCAICDPATG